ncbi:uncharacterized protein M6B38_338990 [Iris pallida]|uniref:N-acetyltransferase domain-containing protein n=1 Tax=Iris pallida TaxID=29817 RepID=A0AAX6GZQ6_IRIPA|nr:uncharacterized protein M6B38_338990 [Iris pallida]
MAMASPSASPLSLSLSIDTLSSSSSSTFPHRPSLSFLSSPRLPSLSAHKTHLNSFLDPTSLLRLRTLDSFLSTRPLRDRGSLDIRPMAPDEAGPASDLLAESFSESTMMPAGYAKLLAFLVRQYVSERSALVPHAVMLVGFYREDGGEAELACTAEISFDARGANAAPPTPSPPRNCPYICNMTVKKSLRRKGIGRELLNACEELISQMRTIRKVYLHCRMIDTVPFGMYRKAGYKIIKTDSILVWFTFQRRKYLMCKELPPSYDVQSDTPDYDEHKQADNSTVDS